MGRRAQNNLGDTSSEGHASASRTTPRSAKARRRGRKGAEAAPEARAQAAVVSAEGNDVGIDPHKKTLTASILDRRGGAVATASFRVSKEGHRQLEAWVGEHGPLRRFGIEGASALGRHTAMYLVRAGYDVRDVCPNRTNERERGRRRGKSDAIDSVKIAREVQADPDLPVAFKRAGTEVGPDETTECLAIFHQARRSLLKSRQHLLNEAEALLMALPEELTTCLPDTSEVRPRLGELAKLTPEVTGGLGQPDRLRVELLGRHHSDIAELDRREAEIVAELARLVGSAGSTLSELCGIAERSDAELLVEVGDPRRFASAASFARFNGTAPIPASSAEGDGEPKRHRLNRGGNRRVNAILHRMAVTQLRCDTRAKAIYENSRAHGHTKKEAMRVLKRHLSDVVYRRMVADTNRRLAVVSETSPQAA